MSQKITVNWIKANQELLINNGIANGIGSKDKASKIYKWVLKNILHKDKSFYYGAAIIHDSLYYVGGQKGDKIKADWAFFVQMLRIWCRKLKSFKFLGIRFYLILAVIFFLAVLFFGDKAFTWRDRPLKKDELLKLLKRNVLSKE